MPIYPSTFPYHLQQQARFPAGFRLPGNGFAAGNNSQAANMMVHSMVQSHQQPSSILQQSRSPVRTDSSEVSRGAGQNAEKSCRICGDRATGLHYGIISCEGCKGFFKRSICNRRVYRCTRDKQCMMSRKQRNRCQYCRLKRCLESGMNRKAIREDGMPGGRNKSIGPIQMTHEEITAVMDGSVFVEERAALTGGSVNQIQNLSQQSQQSHMPLRLPESPLPSISRALEAPPALRQPQSIFRPGMLDHTNFSSGLTPTQVIEKRTRDEVGDVIDIEERTALPPLQEISPNDQLTPDSLMMTFAKTADELLRRQIDWAKALPFSTEISLHDHTTLLMSTWAETMLLYSLTIHHQAVFETLGTAVVNSPHFSGFEPSEEELKLIKKTVAVHSQFASLDIIHDEFCIMKLINFLNHDIIGLHESVKIEAQNKRFWFLCQHWLVDRKRQQGRFRDLIKAIPDMRILAAELKKINDVHRLGFIFKEVVKQTRAAPVALQRSSILALPSMNFMGHQQ